MDHQNTGIEKGGTHQLETLLTASLIEAIDQRLVSPWRHEQMIGRDQLHMLLIEEFE